MADQTSTISANAKATADKPKGWKMTTLGEVLEPKGYIRGPFGSALKRDEMLLSGVPVYEQQNAIYDNRFFRFFIDKDKYRTLSRFTVRENDLVISCSGTVGRITIIKKGDPIGIISQALLLLRPDTTKILPNYLHNFFLSKEGYNSLISRSTGSVQVNIAERKIIENIDILLPLISEQRAIAAVLLSLDNKIELLREQNKTLEATAQAIFKEWFVNFNFPDATGKMVDSGLGEIPEGWRVEKISDIFDFIKGSEPGAANYSNEKLNNNYVPFYRVQDISQYGDIPNIYVEEKLLRGKIFSPDDILISLDGTIGRVFIGGAGGHSGGIRRVVKKRDFIKKSLIFCFLKSLKFQSGLGSFSKAETTIKHAGGAIEHIKFALNEDLCEKFGEVFDPFFYKVISNISQIQTLSKLRDTLLPKLMKGEVRVKGFED